MGGLVELKTPVKVNLWGHEAQITWISWRRANPLFGTDDELLVQFDLSEAAYGVSGFGISLPALDFNKEGFLREATSKGEEELQAIAARHKDEQEKRKKEEKREKELNTIVQNIVNQLEV